VEIEREGTGRRDKRTITVVDRDVIRETGGTTHKNDVLANKEV
jgi:hypothetical protein